MSVYWNMMSDEDKKRGLEASAEYCNKPSSLPDPAGSSLDIADCCVTLDDARDVIRRTEHAGYIIAMRLLQSDLDLDDYEMACAKRFICSNTEASDRSN